MTDCTRQLVTSGEDEQGRDSCPGNERGGPIPLIIWNGLHERSEVNRVGVLASQPYEMRILREEVMRLAQSPSASKSNSAQKVIILKSQLSFEEMVGEFDIKRLDLSPRKTENHCSG
ncbi:hypothetical protein VULLAG_LOCUS8606 [Vulpes lagopus]